MNKTIALVIAGLGIAILILQLVLTVSSESSKFFFLSPIGLLMTMGAAAYIIIQNRKQGQ